ncbi:MAG: hypothetical protein ACLQU1_25885 [Bryobacteraceae bacterium]
MAASVVGAAGPNAKAGAVSKTHDVAKIHIVIETKKTGKLTIHLVPSGTAFGVAGLDNASATEQKALREFAAQAAKLFARTVTILQAKQAKGGAAPGSASAGLAKA